MKYKSLKVKDIEYKFRFTTKSLEKLEKDMGETVQNTIMKLNVDSVDFYQKIRIIVWGSMMEFHKEITLDDVYKLFDDLIDIGYTVNDFVKLVHDILMVSGLISKKRCMKRRKKK